MHYFGVKGEARRCSVTGKLFCLGPILSLFLLLLRNPNLLHQALRSSSPTHRTHSQELIKCSRDHFVIAKGIICVCLYNQE